MNVLYLFSFLLTIAQPDGTFCFCGTRDLHADLTRAVTRSSDWLYHYYKDNSSFMTPSLASSIVVSLRLYGHQRDVLLSELRNSRAQNIKETLKNYLDKQDNTYGNLTKIAPAKLSSIIEAVIAICENPKDFYGHNLQDTLSLGLKTFRKSQTFNNYFQYALTIIALCNGGINVPGEAVDELLSGANTDFSIHSNDFDAMVLTALSCVKRNHKPHRSESREVIRSRALKIRTASARLTWKLITSQNASSGDFGNQYSTGLAVQALLAADVNPNFWHCEKAMRNILSYQDSKGSFGTVLANIQITPALLGQPKTVLRGLSCQNPTPPPEQLPKITVSVELVFNDTTNPLRSEPPVTVSVQEGTTAYEILELAKQQNPCYTATYKQYSWGRSVTSICGVTKKSMDNLYWMIYVDGSLAKYGVDGLKPKRGSLLTFKYQKVQI